MQMSSMLSLALHMFLFPLNALIAENVHSKTLEWCRFCVAHGIACPYISCLCQETITVRNMIKTVLSYSFFTLAFFSSVVSFGI